MAQAVEKSGNEASGGNLRLQVFRARSRTQYVEFERGDPFACGGLGGWS